MAEVLFVDDEPHLLLPFQLQLQARDHLVRFIKRGEDALEYLDEHRGQVAVVVLDVMMGFTKIEDEIQYPLRASDLLSDRWTGVRVFERIRRDHPTQKVVFRTIKGERDLRDYARTNYPALAIDAPVFTKGSPSDDAFMPTLLSMLEDAEPIKS